MVGCQNLLPRPSTQPQHGRIVTRSLHNIGARGLWQGRQPRIKGAPRGFGPASATQRALPKRLRQALRQRALRVCTGSLAGGRGLHVRQIQKPRHKAAINPVFPPPQPSAAQMQAKPNGHGGFAAC